VVPQTSTETILDTSTPVLPSFAPTATASGSGSGGGFFQNTAAVAGVFTIAGLAGLALIVALVTNSIRRQRARRFDREVAEAAAAAASSTAGPNHPFFDDDDGGPEMSSAGGHPPLPYPGMAMPVGGSPHSKESYDMMEFDAHPYAPYQYHDQDHQYSAGYGREDAGPGGVAGVGAFAYQQFQRVPSPPQHRGISPPLAQAFSRSGLQPQFDPFGRPPLQPLPQQTLYDEMPAGGLPVRRVTRRAVEGDSPFDNSITRYTSPPPAINPTREGVSVGEQADGYQSGRSATHSPDSLLPGRAAYTALSTRPAASQPPSAGPQTALVTADQQDSLPNPFRSRNSHEYLHEESSNGHSAGDYSGTTSGAGSGTSGGLTTSKEKGVFLSPPARESTASLGDNEDYTARRVLKVTNE